MSLRSVWREPLTTAPRPLATMLSVVGLNTGETNVGNLLNQHQDSESRLYHQLHDAVDGVIDQTNVELATESLAGFVTRHHVARLIATLRAATDSDDTAIAAVLDYYDGPWFSVATFETYFKNSRLGFTRLVSSPARVTDVVDGKSRPTLGSLGWTDIKSFDDFVEQWFRFVEPSGKLNVLRRVKALSVVKYPALTPEEARDSVALQIFHLMLHDFVMVRFAIRVLGVDGVNKLHAELTDEMLSRPDYFDALAQTVRALADNDFIALSEVSLRGAEQAAAALHKTHTLHKGSRFDPDTSYNSVLLYKRSEVRVSADVTNAVIKAGKLETNHADLCVLLVERRVAGTAVFFVVGAFHSNSSGTAAAAAVHGMNAVAKEHGVPLVFYIDANCERPDVAEKEGRVSIGEFLQTVHDTGLRVVGDNSAATRPGTSPKAWTHFQPQRHKAVTRAELFRDKAKHNGPKDFVVYSARAFEEVSGSVVNRSDGGYDFGAMLPRANFPFDHLAVQGTLAHLVSFQM